MICKTTHYLASSNLSGAIFSHTSVIDLVVLIGFLFSAQGLIVLSPLNTASAESRATSRAEIIVSSHR